MDFRDSFALLAEQYENRDFSIRRYHFPYVRAIGYIVFFAFIIRLVIGAGYLNDYDTEWNIMWALQLREGFFSAYIHVNSLDYPPLYLYPLYIVGSLIRMESIGGYPPMRMLAIKFVPCLTDSLTCLVLYCLASKRGRLLGLLAAALWALNPAAVFNCACWGQTDCVLMFMASLLMLALQQKQVTAAGILWAAMCSTKLQGLYLTPVAGMDVLTICFGRLHPKEFSLDRFSKPAVKRFAKFVCGAAGTLALIYLPFMIGSAASKPDPDMRFAARFFRPITVYSSGVAKYPCITLNADNIYMLFRLNGVEDKMRILPGVSVSALSTLFLVLSMALVVAVYLFGKRRSQWLAGFMFMQCVFMLTCRQHERYQILTLVLLIGAFVTIADRRLMQLYLFQSMVVFFNQFRVLSYVREKTNWWNYYEVHYSTAQWKEHWGIYARSNALINVILFGAAMVFITRYFFDDKNHKPVVSRIIEIFSD